MVTSEEKSVCILRAEKNGSLKFDFEALKSILTKIGERSIVIVSINGAARTGKSFLLSNLFGCLSGGLDPYWIENVTLDAFPWRSGLDCETKGIRMSTQPLITKRNGKEIALLLLDTEGCFDKTSTMNENAIIFAVSSILSSILIFNVMRNINEADLQFFSLFCNYANSAKGQDKDSKGSPFQKLLFLVRDFEFPEYRWGYYDDNKMPERQLINYKTKTLDPNVGQSTETQETRRNLEKWFQEVGMFLLPDPGKGLRREGKVLNMDPEFEEYLFKFIKFMVLDENLKIKTINEKEMTATQLLDRISFLADLFDGNNLPTVENIFKGAEKMQYKVEKSAAIDFLFALIPKTTPVLPPSESIELWRQETISKFHSDTFLQNEEFFKLFAEELNLIIEILYIIRSYKEGIEHLKEILKRAESLDTGCKIAKTTGTVASVGGALLGVGSVICFALAPLSGGLTLGLGVSALSIGLAGGATKISSNVTNKVMSRKLVTDFQENQKHTIELLQGILKRLDENLYFQIFKEKAQFSLIPSEYDSTKKVLLDEGPKLVVDTALNTGTTTASTTTGVMLIADAVVDSAGTILTASAREVVKRAAAGVSVVFAAYEIFDLVNNWTPNHPLTPHIQDMIQQYSNEIQAWETLAKEVQK